jgi:hypothetical protein
LSSALAAVSPIRTDRKQARAIATSSIWVFSADPGLNLDGEKWGRSGGVSRPGSS